MLKKGDVDEAMKHHFPRRFDTLKLAHALKRSICREAGIQHLRSRRLKDLIALLGIEGVNSHKADDDVAATVNLMKRFRRFADEEKDVRSVYRAKPGVIAFSKELRSLMLENYLRHKALMHMPMPVNEEAVTVFVLREFIESLPESTVSPTKRRCSVRSCR